MIYRPPSEAYSLLVQITIGCSHNQCTFCSMFKDKIFRVRPIEEILENIDTARTYYSHVERVFLCDGDALCLSADKLLMILGYIRKKFPECQRINVYGSPKDVLQKTPQELAALCDAGMEMIYIGAESGSDKVLSDVKKGATRKEIIEAVRRIETAGIKASVTFISGLAGKEGWRDHAIETGTMISEMKPSYAALLTLMTEPGAPLTEDVKSGRFKLLSAEEVLAETALLLEHVELDKPCVFRSNHASNYLSLRGNLPEDKEKMLTLLQKAMADTGMLKDERFRAL